MNSIMENISSSSNAVTIKTIKNHYTLLCYIILFISTTLLYGKFLLKTPVGGDFYGPVSYALNFKKSFDDGQWIPRFIIPARTYPYQPYTNDRTDPTQDSTAFMYYGFLSSALAYPFLTAGLSGQQALGCVIYLSFLVAVFCLFHCGKVLGASKNISVIASLSYLLSPSPICNIFTRGGIAEGLSHALLPLLLLGLAFVLKKRHIIGVFLIATGIFLLALAHNIFLLWGVTFCLFFAAFYVITSLVLPPSHKLLSAFHIPLLIVIGIAIGMAMSAWQWLPALLTLDHTQLQQMALNHPGSASAFGACDFSGVFGIPRLALYNGTKTVYYYTIGWWTIPSIVLALIVCCSHLKRMIISLSLVFVCFFLLTYFPGYFFELLPQQFSATQGTYRLLAFLSLIGSFALCFIQKRISMRTTLIIITLMMTSQIGVLYHSFSSLLTTYPDDLSINTFELNDFHPDSPFLVGYLRETTGGRLLMNNKIDTSVWTKIITQAENDTSQNHLKKSTDIFNVRIKGQSLNPFPTDLYIIPYSKKTTRILLSPKKIVKDNFDLIFTIHNPHTVIQLKSNEIIPKNSEAYNFIPNQMYLIDDNPRSYIYADHLIKTESHGYKRLFTINTQSLSQFSPNIHGYYTVEIPMIYNKYIEVSQGGKKLLSWCDLNHRINVKTTHLSLPIQTQFKLPKEIISLSLLGCLIWAILLVYTIKTHQQF